MPRSSKLQIVCAAWLGVVCGLAASSEAAELTEIFQPTTKPNTLSADQVVDRAFANLFVPDFMMSIETVRTNPAGQRERAVFRVLRRVVNGSLRILTESLEPESIAGTRVLQVERPDGIEQTYAFVRSLGREPFETTYRLADPFLCTWFEQEGIAPTEAGVDFGGRHEVLARRPDEVSGERVQRITVRPMIARGYDRIELVIADRDFAILEYLHYVGASDLEPSLIARADRKDMITLDGHVLPSMIRYEDRLSRDVILVTIEHAQLPPEIPNILFEPRSFHRARTDRVPAADLEQ